jgi:hypothetical protein
MQGTAATPERGGHARLIAHLAALERATAEREPASERLRRELGDELAHRLVFALSGSGRGRCRVEAAA